MAKAFAKAFYNSEAWRQCRYSYISKRLLIDFGVCEECKVEPGYIVHHKIELTPENINDPNITLNHDNLMYVCKRCHDQYDGHWSPRNKRKIKVEFDENGQPIDRRNI